MGIAHRDLKPENLLLSENFDAKITDFGHSNYMNKNNSGLLKTYIGTKCYRAPEIDGVSFYSGELVDVFALGVILFNMVIVHFPFLSPNEHLDLCYRPQKYWKQKEAKFKFEFSEDFK